MDDIDSSKLNWLNYMEEVEKGHAENLSSTNQGKSIKSFYLTRYSDEKLKEKRANIEELIAKLMYELGLPNDYYKDSIMETPRRVAKMLINETFRGLIGNNYPKVSKQLNHFNYNAMLIESGIEINSCCEHHLVPILGKAHIAYLPDKYLLGLSKLNRLSDFHARRPQIQERLTVEIAEDLSLHLGNKDVAVCIDAIHCCVKMRGIQDSNCVTRTYHLMGQFREEKYRSEFFTSIPDLKEFRL